jgi:hypothetical protein
VAREEAGPGENRDIGFRPDLVVDCLCNVPYSKT